MPPLRWTIAALLFTATVINYVDRQALSIVAPVLTRELHISPTQYAAILQAFLIAYTVMYVGSGLLVDRWGTRISQSVFVVWWSLSSMLHALATTAFGFGVCRFLLGLGEPGNFMASLKAISEWYPPRERAFVNGLVNAGAALGAIIATPLVAWLLVRFGWRAAFVVTGSFGFFWLAAWLFIYYVPERHSRLRPSELALIQESRGSAALDEHRPSWRELLTYRQTWGLLLARFVSDPVWWFYLFWLPKYLVDQRGFTIVQVGLLAWLPYLAADLGSVAGGLASGYLIKRHWQPLQARFAAMVPCALFMPVSLFIALTPSVPLALLVICGVTFSHMAWKTNLVTMTNDIYPPAVIGSVAGIVAFGSGLGATVFTNLTGWVVQNSSYTAIFAVMGFLHPASLLLVRLLVRTPLLPTTREEQPLDSVPLPSDPHAVHPQQAIR